MGYQRAGPLPGTPIPEPPVERTPGVGHLAEWALIGGAALLVALLIKLFLLEAFYIPSGSMEPTLRKQDRVLVNKLSYKLHAVHRGDVVVFKRPNTDRGGDGDLIKRVIALPGETVEGRDGHVWIEGKNGRTMLPEKYLPAGQTTEGFAPVTVPAGHYWMMGDNRDKNQSRDSRVFGPVPRSHIVGRAFLRFWPLSSLTLL